MDILNWLYLKSQGLVRTQANDAKTDLVTLGAEVPFTTRGDGYQAYAMPLSDATLAGTTENNTYRTPIFVNFPFIVEPSMVKGTTVFEQSVDSMLPLGTKLETYKVSGVVDLQGASSSDVIYLGTFDYTNGISFGVNKITGSVAFDDTSGTVESALANGALVMDDNTSTWVPLDYIVFNEDAGPNFRDLYLIYDASTATGDISAYVTFEYEVLFVEGTEVTYTVY